MKKNVAEFLDFKFKKIQLLKQTARGEVWLARELQSGNLVVIKRVSATDLPYEILRQHKFKLPAEIFFTAQDDIETVIVEEFIHGENLSARLERRDFLTETQAREILLQMCDGLAELHAHDIIHRDIKPSNMILQGDRIRLIDFDAARLFKPGQESDTKTLGTRGYAPPEQFGSGQTDPRSDIYALGVTMKILLGGHDGGLKNVLDKCTELDPKNRFQDVDELKEALTIEEFDEPETESTSSRRALISVVINLLWFMISKNFHARLFLLTVGIFLLATTSTLHRAEISEPPKISEPQKISTPSATKKPVEKISEPAQFEPFTLPEIVESPITAIELPQTVSPPQKKFSGLLKTEFYLNGVAYNQNEHLNNHQKISRAEWLQSRVSLRVTNDTGNVWQSPTIKFIFGQNWGDKFTDTKILPALAAGESATFEIPFNLFKVSDRSRTHAYIQIYLNGDKSKMNEHYWAIWFDIVD